MIYQINASSYVFFCAQTVPKVTECSKLGARRILRADESDGLSRQALCA